MDGFEEKNFWNIFNSPEVVTLKTTTRPTTTRATVTYETTTESPATHYHSPVPYHVSSLPQESDSLPLTSLNHINHLMDANMSSAGSEITRDGSWLQFMLITALAFAVGVLIVLIAMLAWRSSESKTSTYSLKRSSSTADIREGDASAAEDSV